jgi:tetratricopeptide (TPR) repeat protein
MTGFCYNLFHNCDMHTVSVYGWLKRDTSRYAMTKNLRNKQPAPAQDQSLQQAIAHHQAGLLQDAERLYRAILQEQPQHPDANHNLGVLAVQVRQPAAALPHFKAALEANPNQGQYWLSYIDALIQTGQTETAREALAQGRRQGLQGEKMDALKGRLDGPSSDEIDTLMALFDQERYTDVEVLARRLTERFPRDGYVWKMLGAALRLQGKSTDALEAVRKTVELAPQNAEAHRNMGIILKEQGRFVDAEVSYRRALTIKPDYYEAHYNLGNTLREQGLFMDAESCYRRALTIKPDYYEAYYNLGNVLREQNRLAEAEASYRRALEIKSDSADAQNSLGNILQEQGRLPDAETCYLRALIIEPDYADAHSNMGIALKEQGRFMEAEASCRRALEINPDSSEAYGSLGEVLNDEGRLDEAIFFFDRALAMKPEKTEVAWNRALAYLLKGDLGHGFKEYEYRWLCPALKTRDFRQPVWDGSRIEGHILLVHAEQGFGDAIQFARYLPFAAKTSRAIVVLECQPELMSLLGNLEGVSRIVARGEQLPDFDFHIPLLSLPRIAGTTLETIPSACPYLSPPPEAGHSVRKSEGTRLSVGIAWAGRPTHKRDRNRSVDFSRFLPLATLSGVTLYSLQKGERADDRMKTTPGKLVRDLGEEIRDFGDAARIISQLDLVVTVDTAPAHLAGALGIPVWVLLPFSPDWRWLLDREDSPWYPTMRLFRQSAPGDWDEVFERVRAALGELLEKRG